MKAIVLTEFGDADRLELSDIPEPAPRRGEVKIRVAATSVNPVDWKVRAGGYDRVPPPSPPMVLGRDVAGEVVELGEGVDSFKVGDKVMGFVQRTYAEFVVARARQITQVPEGLDLERAAALPLVATTGVELINEQTKPNPGDTVLVTGALGSVGRSAVYAAKKLGARVLAGVRTRQKEEAASLGADGVVAIDDDREIAALPPLDAIANTIGGDTLEELLPHVKPGGTLGTVLAVPEGAKTRDLKIRAFTAHPDAKILEEFAYAVCRGEVDIPIARTLPLAKAADAHRAMERGGAGKIVLTM